MNTASSSPCETTPLNVSTDNDHTIDSQPTWTFHKLERCILLFSIWLCGTLLLITLMGIDWDRDISITTAHACVSENECGSFRFYTLAASLLTAFILLRTVLFLVHPSPADLVPCHIYQWLLFIMTAVLTGVSVHIGLRSSRVVPTKSIIVVWIDILFSLAIHGYVLCLV